MLDAFEVEEGMFLERLPDGRKARAVGVEFPTRRLPCGCCDEMAEPEVELVWLDNGEIDWVGVESLRELQS